MYHHQLTATLTAPEIFTLFMYGLRMDAAFTGYICIFPFLVFFTHSIFPKLRIQKLVGVYTITLVIILSLLAVIDMELYRFWGFRMDITPFQYLKSPQEMAASAGNSPVILLILIFLVAAFSFGWLYRKAVAPYLNNVGGKMKLIDAVISFFLLIVLFIPIRGGIQKIPLNHSDVYFSNKLFANHAALNVPWNVVHSILNRNSTTNPYSYFPEDSASQLVNSLYDSTAANTRNILSSSRPNIIIVILESFTAKLVGAAGGEQGVTPNLDSIAANGLNFTNAYAAGDRSEKGQVGILSGYPNQAITSIIKSPTKTTNLPSLNRALQKAGYYTSYIYGGELEFANIKSYLLNTGYKNLVSKYSFPEEQRTTSWGVHDEYLFSKFFSDLTTQPQPFFSTVFTLSSHEPFDVPMPAHFTGNDETTMFKNSIYYTDSIVGDFMRKISQQPWYRNTVVIIVADHGHPIPNYDRNDLPSKFHIPLIISGGALAVKGTISQTVSQTDIAKTLLHQLHLDASEFKWSRDVLADTANSFAFYSFNDGFGFMTDSSATTFDNTSRKVLYHSQPLDTQGVRLGKAYMQESYRDFLQR